MDSIESVMPLQRYAIPSERRVGEESMEKGKYKNAKRIQEKETRRFVFRLMKGLNEDCTRQMKYTAKEEEAL